MKVLAPIREFDELEMLAAAGAEELYCGIVPQEWLDRYQGAVWLNRRSPKGANLTSLEEMKRLSQAAHDKSIPLFVALNAPSYSEQQIPLVLDLCDRLSEECGVDAIIVSDLNLMLQWSERKRHARLHVSSIATTLNTEAIRFLLNFNPERIILPRSLTLDHIRRIAEAVKDEVEIEVFVLNDGCVFEEGFCSTTHHHSVGAFCTDLSNMQYDFEWNGRHFSKRRRAWLSQNLTDFREFVWYLNGNGCSVTPKGLPYGPCGLCALHDLARIGVHSLKIVGRESAAFKKMASVRMVRAIVDQVRAGATREAVIDRSVRMRETPEHCRSGYMCYYKVEGAPGDR